METYPFHTSKRIVVIVGHYGSGKTEFSLQYALHLASQGTTTAVVDLDIANPYFRSRQQQDHLQAQGVQTYSNVYHYDITAELPAIAATIRAPLEDKEVHTVVDAGGDDSGARVLIQFQKYFTPDDSDILCVINANRPETRTPENALAHIRRIEAELGRSVSALVSNTHMLRETTSEDVMRGISLCHTLSRQSGIPLRYTLCTAELISEVTHLMAASKETSEHVLSLFPFKELQMRETWLDAHSYRSTYRFTDLTQSSLSSK